MDEQNTPRVLTEAEQWELAAAEIALTEAARKAERADDLLRDAGYKVKVRPMVLGGYLQRFRRRVDSAMRQSKTLAHRSTVASIAELRDVNDRTGDMLERAEAGR